MHKYMSVILFNATNFVHISFKVARLRAKNLKISLLVEGSLRRTGDITLQDSDIYGFDLAVVSLQKTIFTSNEILLKNCIITVKFN